MKKYLHRRDTSNALKEKEKKEERRKKKRKRKRGEGGEEIRDKYQQHSEQTRPLGHSWLWTGNRPSSLLVIFLRSQ